MEGQVEHRSLRSILERLVLSCEGVVGVESRVSYPPDDAALTRNFSLYRSWPMPRVDR